MNSSASVCFQLPGTGGRFPSQAGICAATFSAFTDTTSYEPCASTAPNQNPFTRWLSNFVPPVGFTSFPSPAACHGFSGMKHASTVPRAPGATAFAATAEIFSPFASIVIFGVTGALPVFFTTAVTLSQSPRFQ